MVHKLLHPAAFLEYLGGLTLMSLVISDDIVRASGLSEAESFLLEIIILLFQQGQTELRQSQ